MIALKRGKNDKRPCASWLFVMLVIAIATGAVFQALSAMNNVSLSGNINPRFVTHESHDKVRVSTGCVHSSLAVLRVGHRVLL